MIRNRKECAMKKINSTKSLILSAMKNMPIFIAGLLLISFISNGSNAQQKEKDVTAEQYLTVVCSPDISPLALQWAEQYNLLGTGTMVNVKELGTAPADNTVEDNHVGLVSCAWLGAMEGQSLDKMIIARDVIVPVMNPDHPLRNEIVTRGISPDRISRMLSNTVNYNWADLLGEEYDHPLHLYILEDAAMEETLRGFLGAGTLNLKGKRFGDAGEMIRVMQDDPYALGFCHLNDIIDHDNYAFISGIEIMPIDKNANGQLDYFENIYTSPEAFSRSVWIGKYPRELVSGIYALAAEGNLSAGATGFMKWLLTDGQPALLDYGYSDLVSGEVRSNLDRITEEPVIIEPSKGNFAGLKIALMVLVIFIVLGIIIESVILYKKYRTEDTGKVEPVHEGAFNENTVRVPGGLFFDKTHTWAFMQSDGKVRIGLDDFLPRVTGELTGIRMKNPGESIKKGEVILSLVQKGKQLNIKAPVSGVILEQNKRLLHNTSAINFDPYSSGWIYMIEPTNWLREIQLMLMADRFRAWLKGEFVRLKDFFATIHSSDELQYARVVYQEGGEMKEGVLTDLGPEVWEDFQSHFIETTT